MTRILISASNQISAMTNAVGVGQWRISFGDDRIALRDFDEADYRHC